MRHRPRAWGRRVWWVTLGLVGLVGLPVLAAVGLVALVRPGAGPRGPQPLPPYTAVSALAVSADGRRVAASGAYDQDRRSVDSLRVWDTRAGGPTLAREFRLRDGTRLAGWRALIALSPDGAVLAALSLDVGRQREVVALWDVETGAVLAEVDRPDADGNLAGPMPGEGLTFAADGAEVAYVGRDALVTVRVPGGAATVRPLRRDPFLRYDYVPGPRRVAAVRSNPKTLRTELLTWDPAAGGEPAAVRLANPYIGFRWFAFADDGRSVAVLENGEPEGAVLVHDPADGRLVASWPLPGATGRTRELALSADGRRVAVGPTDQGGGTWAVEVWSVDDTKLLHRAVGAEDPAGGEYAAHLTFSRDGSTLLYVRRKAAVVRMDTATGRETED